MKRIAIPVLIILILFGCLTGAVYAANPPVPVVKVPNRAAVIDGKASAGEWDGATALVLNPTDPRSWNNGFLGNILPPSSHTNADFNNTIKLMVKDGYLYYFEERIDTTPFYGSNDIRKSYCQDGTLIWFVNTSGTRHSLSVFATNKGSAPFMMFNRKDNQPAGTRLNCEIVSVIRDNGFLIEAKIALSDLLLKESDFINGKMMTTYCCVNIYNSSFSGNAEDLWGDYGYEPWYTGVNNWMISPKIQVIGLPSSSSPSSSVSSKPGQSTVSSRVDSSTASSTQPSANSSHSSAGSVTSPGGDRSTAPVQADVSSSPSGRSTVSAASKVSGASSVLAGTDTDQFGTDIIISDGLPASDGEGAENSPRTWLYVLISAIAVAAIAGAVVFFILRSKRRIKAE